MCKTQCDIHRLPKDLQSIALKRQQARQLKDFAAADKYKQALLQAGIEIQDTPTDTHYFVITQEQTTSNSMVLLFSSGETASVSIKAHTRLFQQLDKSHLRIAILTTPAGFQPNVDVVYQEIADFFTHSLQNFHPHIDIIYAHNRQQADNDTIIAPLAEADYIFTGPGSPTYACKTLQHTKALALIHTRLHQGASLGLASAATIAFSQWCLPVYEIYKVGTELHWLPGLNIFADFYRPLTIVPHFNNQEGGDKLDTSYCYMGVQRFKSLRALLPPSTPMWGLDEYTAVMFDTRNDTSSLFGSGKLHKDI